MSEEKIKKTVEESKREADKHIDTILNPDGENWAELRKLTAMGTDDDMPASLTKCVEQAVELLASLWEMHQKISDGGSCITVMKYDKERKIGIAYIARANDNQDLFRDFQSFYPRVIKEMPELKDWHFLLRHEDGTYTGLFISRGEVRKEMPFKVKDVDKAIVALIEIQKIGDAIISDLENVMNSGETKH